jgi:hypothetical protein
MRSALATLATTAVAATAALVLAAPATALPPNFYGVDSIHEPDGREFGLMRQSGVQIYRMPMMWRQIEPNAPVELGGRTIRSYDWSAPDRYVRRAAQTGVSLHVGLNNTPYWVAEDQRTSPMRSAQGRVGWRAFVAAVVDRYGLGGKFWAENTDLPQRPPVTYQVWNEQNTTGRYRPVANPAEYGRLLRIAGREIRAREPRAQIIPGGMFGTPQTPNSYTAWGFMWQLLREPGVRRYIDAAAIHPYSPNLRGVRYQFRKMRQVLKRSGRAKLPLHVTEIGWSSGTSDDFFTYKGRGGQARLLRRSFKLMHERRKRWKLKRIMWFSWRDVRNAEIEGNCGWCNKMGLLDFDLRPKPSYKAYTRFSLKRRSR